MRLHPRPFGQIKEGTKTIEIRLNDEKRRQIKVGDKVEFSSRAEPEDKIMTKVVDLLHFPTFSELFDAYPPEVFGATNKEDLMSIYKYYTAEEEKRYGVVGIKIKYSCIPQIIKDVGFDFDWDSKKVWALDIPTIEMDIQELVWHFDIPFWELEDTDSYNLTPVSVIHNEAGTKEHRRKIEQADVKYPIDIMENKGRWLILDGLHRLVKLYEQGAKIIQIRIIPRDRIPEISKNK